MIAGIPARGSAPPKVSFEAVSVFRLIWGGSRVWGGSRASAPYHSDKRAFQNYSWLEGPAGRALSFTSSRFAGSSGENDPRMARRRRGQASTSEVQGSLMGFRLLISGPFDFFPPPRARRYYLLRSQAHAAAWRAAKRARRRCGAEHRPSLDWQPRLPDRQWQPGAEISAGGLGVSAVAMLGRAVDQWAQMVVSAG